MADPPQPKSAAARLSELLDHLGMDESKFARRIGVSASLVNRVRRGQRVKGPGGSPSIVAKSFAVLGLRPEFWSEDGDPARFLGPKPDRRTLIDFQNAQFAERGVEGVLEDAFEAEVAAAQLRSERFKTAVTVAAADAGYPIGVIERLQEGEAPSDDAIYRWLRAAVPTDFDRRPKGTEQNDMDLARGLVDAEIVRWWVRALLNVLDGRSSH